jgi:two-component system, oxyanion-binding sensor
MASGCDPAWVAADAFFIGLHCVTSDLGSGLETTTVRLGFIPLTDCAPIAVAGERGIFAKYGLDVQIVRQASWANVRDKVAIGALEGGHMLAAMPLSATLGLGGFERPIVTAVSLGLNGCAITVSTALWRQMTEIDAAAGSSALAAAHALARVIARRRTTGAPPLVFAAVFPYSMHNYLLRYWLAAAGIDPETDVRIRIVPPPMMVANLAGKHIDGFCVGEPWGQRAVDLGIGCCAAISRNVWAGHPDKVLGVAAEWAARHPNTHRALIAAVIEAAAWLDEPENRLEGARILARGYIDLPEEIIAASLTGRTRPSVDDDTIVTDDFHLFYRNAANFPWRSHAEWILAQMRRWGQIDPGVNIRATAAAVYRPDIYRDVMAALGLPCPIECEKTEGTHAGAWTVPAAPSAIPMGPDLFMDGRIFDPGRFTDYVADFGITKTSDDPRGRQNA